MQNLLSMGTMEVAPLTAPRLIFVWGPQRGLPVRINTYSISEDAFDAQLNPIRATVSLAMRVLNYSDLNSNTRDYHLFQAHQQSMEAIARQAVTSSAQNIGIDPSIL